MESVNKLEYKLTNNPAKSKENVKVKYKKITFNATIVKKRLIVLNICLSIIFAISLVTGYTDMVGINSDNLIMQNANDKLAIEINSLKDISDKLTADKRIESIAKANLSMVYPKNADVKKLAGNDEKLLSIADFSPTAKTSTSNNFFTAITNIFR